MPRVVPSQLVSLIDKVFPQAQTATEQKNFILSREHSTAVAGVLDLLRQLPQDLITISGEQYAEFVISIAALETLSEQWVHGDLGFPHVPGLRRLNPVAIIRQILAACDNEFPSPGTANLTFVSEDLRDNLRMDISATNSALRTENGKQPQYWLGQ